MKRLLLGMLAIMMLGMSGCGDATVAVVVPIVINPPSITLNPFSQDRVREFVDGSVVFFAPDSDIDTMTVVVIDNFDGSIRSKITSFPNFPGVTQGTIPFSIDYITYPNGSYTFSIYLTDFNRNISNQVVGTFSVP